MRVFSSPADLEQAVGEHLGFTDWVRIDQSRVDRFAEATGDLQWIHVDPERAAEGPFGTTIAHGYLTLALLPWLASQLVHLEGLGTKLNYGLNRVRFPHVVRVGDRVRAGATITSAAPVEGGLQLVTSYVVEVEGADKPALVAETIVMLLPS